MAKPELAMLYKRTMTLPTSVHFTATQVRVMARAEGYAMVRRKGCAPFVVSEKELVNPGAPLLPTTTAGGRDARSTTGSNFDAN